MIELQLNSGITITTTKIEDFSAELGIIEFLRILIQNPRKFPNEITVYGLDRLLFSSEEPKKVIKIIYFLLEKIPSYNCIQMIISCDIRSSGSSVFFYNKFKEIKINPLFKRSLKREYSPDRFFVTV